MRTARLDHHDFPAANPPDVRWSIVRSLFFTCRADLDFCPTSEAAVRINPVSSGMAGDDLAAVLSAKRLPNALVVPKVEGPDEVHWLMDRARQLLAKQRQRQQLGQGSSSGDGSASEHTRQQSLALVTMCESALALLDLR
jgi:citrate lyase beta subunit